MDTAAARAIVDASSYMTLATADADGAPWASPVWFAHEQYETFLWMSRPDARHLSNIAARREIAIVIFDSTVSPDQRNAVYVEAAAAIVPDVELADAVAVYAARSVARGLETLEIGEVSCDAPWRLYRARHPWCTCSKTSTIGAWPCNSRVDHASLRACTSLRTGRATHRCDRASSVWFTIIGRILSWSPTTPSADHNQPSPSAYDATDADGADDSSCRLYSSCSFHQEYGGPCG